mmetsp:Transcript_19397/g.27744  ORF Transcript_19397/g.27744 Transcript_19397/m.27744 type:complete len:196 (+) Transcript_19397:115-702(+)
MDETEEIEYVEYSDESMLNDVKMLVSKDLSEPYSVFTYRYFLHNWPQLCICAYAVPKATNYGGEISSKRKIVATIVCKLEGHENKHGVQSGYIAMLAVDKSYRKRGIGLKLATLGIDKMISFGCLEVVLEAEASNAGALSLYTKLGFVKEEKLARYYLNGGDAFRLKLWIDKVPTKAETTIEDNQQVQDHTVTVS